MFSESKEYDFCDHSVCIAKRLRFDETRYDVDGHATYSGTHQEQTMCFCHAGVRDQQLTSHSLENVTCTYPRPGTWSRSKQLAQRTDSQPCRLSFSLPSLTRCALYLLEDFDIIGQSSATEVISSPVDHLGYEGRRQMVVKQERRLLLLNAEFSDCCHTSTEVDESTSRVSFRPNVETAVIDLSTNYSRNKKIKKRLKSVCCCLGKRRKDEEDSCDGILKTSGI